MSLEQIPLKRTMRRKSHLFRLAKWYFFTPQPVCVSRFPVKRQGRIPCLCCLAGLFQHFLNLVAQLVGTVNQGCGL
jgi:hypothetical protein